MFETVNEKALLCSLMYNEQHHGVLPIIGNPLPFLPSVIVFTECDISLAVSSQWRYKEKLFHTFVPLLVLWNTLTFDKLEIKYLWYHPKVCTQSERQSRKCSGKVESFDKFTFVTFTNSYSWVESEMESDIIESVKSTVVLSIYIYFQTPKKIGEFL